MTHSHTARTLAFKYVALSLLAAFGMLAMSDAAMAQQSPMGNVICLIIGIIYGNLGRGIAVLAVIILGVGATIGKVSWGLAMTVGVGIGTIFGAVPLTAYLISANSAMPICFTIGGVQ
jgi:type IV secretory pathway VirB2 component (pilin)